VPALSHAGLVGDADVSLASAAAAGDGLYALDFVADSVVKVGVGQEDQPVRAGVRVRILIDFGRAEYARLIHVNSSDLLAGLRGVASTCGAICLSDVYIRRPHSSSLVLEVNNIDSIYS
jgi:hypothetical protein